MWRVWYDLNLAHSDDGDEEGVFLGGGISRVGMFVSVLRSGVVFGIGHQNGRSFQCSAAQ